jgi:hypothetical protein
MGNLAPAWNFGVNREKLGVLEVLCIGNAAC